MRSVQRCRDLLLTVAVNAVSAPPGTFFYGGQAVIEGVLMRGRDHYAVAARRPDGEIVVCTDVLRSRVYTRSVWRRPFLRGVAGLYETIHLGMRALQWSAVVQLGQEAEIGTGAIRGAMIASLVFALALFIGVPLLLGGLLHHATQSITSVLIEGVIRAVILVAYLLLIGLIPNVRRLFEYHGAEHMAINALESGSSVDVDHVRASSRLHPRCGTGFLVVVALVSVGVFAPLGLLPTAVRLVCQIALVPLVAAVSYEVIRALIRIRGTVAGRIALAPVLGAQLLSTRVPDDSQIEVSIAALDAARHGDVVAYEALGMR
ncbi:MAG TPA: DUF1385 domain-containing protein [Candidatus Dormibacteraeota bacterium]|jgi:uncharacterized protein YqhQ